jgi:hypothetical protein
MDYHEPLKIIGGVFTLLLFIPMIVGVFRDGGVGQSFATWSLWVALDCVLVGSLVVQHGNYFMALGFAIGDTVLASVLLAKGRAIWSKFDTFILGLVVVSLVVWGCSGPKLATIASTLGCLIAGMPGMLALWRAPQRGLGNVWAGYALANSLSFFGGVTMTVEERFAPGAFTVFAVAMFLTSRRKAAK